MTNHSWERAAAQELDRLVNILTGFERQLDAVRGQYNDQETPDSLVARELADEAALSTPEVTRPLLDAFGIATIRMVAASDHLVILSRAIEAPPRPFAPQTLARQGVELAARAWYLLDPGITPKERAARYVTDMLHSLWEGDQRGMMMADGSPPSDRVKKLRAWAERVGVKVSVTSRGRCWVGCVDRPSTTQVLREMMGDIGAAGYHVFSSPSHGGIGGLVDRLVHEQFPGAEKGVGARVVVCVADIALLAAWVVMGCLPAFERYFAVQGWDDGMTVGWRLHAMSTARKVGQAAGLFS